MKLDPNAKDPSKWSVPITPALNQAVNDAIKRGLYSSRSEFVRTACRKALESMPGERS
jgi:Arc/MetJ-type ribon-helix-helix transcriptional regulator